MENNQQLISQSRTLLNKILQENDANSLRELVDEFVEMYEINPKMQQIHSSFEAMKKKDTKHLLVIEKKARQEIDNTYLAALDYAKQQNIQIPERFINSYEQKIISSAGFTISRFDAVRDILIFLDHNGHRSFRMQFTDRDFTECTFSPSYEKWHKEKEKLQNMPWYCFDQLNQFQTKEPYDSEFPFLDESELSGDQHVIYTLGNRMRATGQTINTSRYKKHVKYLHEYNKQLLLNKTEKPDSYDKKTGTLTKDNSVCQHLHYR